MYFYNNCKNFPLLGHTFFMSTHGTKKIVKTLVHHRTCSVCSWWKRQKPGCIPRKHKCVYNHSGSARSIESTAGLQGVRELAQEGTPVDILQGDGDSSMMAKLKEHGYDITKKYDKNHVVKNITSSMYKLQKEKGIKLSKDVISHIEKCLKYALEQNKGNPIGLKENILAIIPHQFGDHTRCQERFCQERRTEGIKYLHQSLPYKAPLSNPLLREKLEAIFNSVANRCHEYSELGSSQANEHANKEVSLKAPKNVHYGGSKALDYRVHASTLLVNEGRSYIPQVSKRML